MTTQKQELLHVPAGAGSSLLMRTDLVTFKVTRQETAGAFLLLEATVPPQGGPPLHTHPEQETFYILEGSFELIGVQDGSPTRVQAGAGETVTIAPHAPHAYKNVGTTTGKLLAFFTPATIQGFFEEVGVPVSDPSHLPEPDTSPEALARFIEAGKKYQFSVVQPPAQRQSQP